VVLDEAYVDFANENALKLALKFPHVLVARTFSKAYSLCFQRVGYFVGHPNSSPRWTKSATATM
jgi:histidinol-phosphate aminotransferase